VALACRTDALALHADAAALLGELLLAADRPADARATLERFKELLQRSNGTLDAREIVRELKAVGGDLRVLRLALTGRDRGPELWTVVAALPKDEALRRIDAAL
jgi:hypothetical protein